MSQLLLKLDERRELAIIPPKAASKDKPLLILAHGAGKGMDSPFLETIANHLEDKNVSTMRFNFPYMTAGRKSPNGARILMESWRNVIEWAGENIECSEMLIGGKRMGGRIATMIASDVQDVKGLVFLGYPLHPPGKFDRVRDDYLYTVRQQNQFVQGTRDAFARMDLLTQTLTRLRDRHKLHWIEGGEHSFKVLVRQGVSYPEVLEGAADVTAEWIHDLAGKNS